MASVVELDPLPASRHETDICGPSGRSMD
jgi:hypothetical protein